VTDGERVADLLKRLQAFMKVSDADFEKWKLHLVYLHRPTLLDPGVSSARPLLFSLTIDPESTINIRDLRYYGSLAFQHPNKVYSAITQEFCFISSRTPRRPRPSGPRRQ
jgi:hypothetical protein